MKGIVFDIRRFCVHDGPGIRTTVFLKGCPLRCRWCHNPESQEKQIEHTKKEIILEGRKLLKDVQIGKEMTINEVLTEIRKDIVFFNESGGGVTFSGGEPLSQPEFLQQLLKSCQQEGLHTAVDTCGYANPEIIEKIRQSTDLFLWDLKHTDPITHKQFTGVDNRLILKNLEMISKHNKKTNIRIPVVPGFNNTVEEMTIIVNYLKSLNGSITGVNLLPYHSMAKAKYSRLSKDFALADFDKVQDNDLFLFREIFEKEGFKTKIGG
ncbi:MAG: glycyl-radical enzyme activating protein [Bacteroidales bacterium]|nr:glycyl-radical enzyme activating protein [Bacteroidales bacterium]